MGRVSSRATRLVWMEDGTAEKSRMVRNMMFRLNGLSCRFKRSSCRHSVVLDVSQGGAKRKKHVLASIFFPSALITLLLVHFDTFGGKCDGRRQIRTRRAGRFYISCSKLCIVAATEEHPDSKHPDSKHPDSKHPDSKHPDSKHMCTTHSQFQ
jgi:hypothetical protein